jgi:hypothetical protein
MGVNAGIVLAESAALADERFQALLACLDGAEAEEERAA